MNNNDIDDKELYGVLYDPNDTSYYKSSIGIYVDAKYKRYDAKYIIENPIQFKNNYDYIMSNIWEISTHMPGYTNFIIKYFDLTFGLDNFDEEKLSKIIKYEKNIMLCQCYDETSAKVYTSIIKEVIRRNNKLPDLCINHSFQVCNWNLIYIYIKKNIVNISSSHLELLFLSPRTKNHTINLKIINEILQNKIMLTQKCFRNLIYANKYVVCDNNLDYYSIFKNKVHCDVTNIISLMYNYGFALTQDNFRTMIKNRIYIENYKKYKLVLDKEIEDICNDILYFPYEEIKVTDIGFEKIMNNNVKLTDLKKIKKKYKLDTKHDEDSLESACAKNIIDVKTIQYLIDDCHIEPNFECLHNLLDRDKVLKTTISCAKYMISKMKNIYQIKDANKKEIKEANKEANKEEIKEEDIVIDINTKKIKKQIKKK
jgi:hypothetical protein